MKNEMKFLLTACLLWFTSITGFGQTLTLTSPEGLPEPYEVVPGTEITVQWDYFSEAPTYMFTYGEDPGNLFDWQFNTNPLWTQLSNWTDNGDGTFSLSLTVNEEVWIFGAFNTFSGNSYSNVISIGIASPIVISAEDGLICPTGGDTELLSVDGTFDGYQWFLNGEAIADATESTYAAPEAGTYYLVVTDADSTIQSNQVIVETLSLAYTGSLNEESTELTLTAGSGMDSYQWYSGPDSENMSMIDGATAMEYVAAITSDLTYYSVEGMSGSCAIMTDTRPVNDAMFIPVIITVNADTNEFNAVCEGSTITLSIDESIEEYQWFKNGFEAYGTHTVTISSSWQTGEYYVVTTPADWPEVSVQSETVNASFLEIIEPLVTGIVNNSFHCEGEEISAILADEGYEYQWFVHENYNAYGDTDLVEAPGGMYTFIFSEATYITVVANYQGCQKEKQTYLKSYEDQNMSIGISNYDQQYLCLDSVADIGINYGNENWDSYQWYQLIDSNWVVLENDTNFRYGASEPGTYKLSGVSINCATAVVESNEYVVKHYQERNMSLWADQNEICLDDTANLTFSNYKWSNIQWFQGEIVIGSSGYELTYIPYAGDTNKVAVTELNHYLVKAKHESCPNGLKVTSNPLVITPSVNPVINIGIEQEPESYRQLLWDTVAFYTFCNDYPLNLSVDTGYTTYQWYEATYSGLDDYELGNPIDGATLNTFSTNAQVQWVTVVVESEGCVGQSNPILLDTWAFQDPVITSYNDNQICVDDSALVHLSFPGTWVEYYWMYEDEFGVWDTVPNSNNDSLWVSEPGQYVIFAFPELCPDFEFTSGLGPNMELFEATIYEDVTEEGDELYYAYPWQGNFTYQWFKDGELYENPSEIPSVLWKEDLPTGNYSVEITNTQPCVSLSEEVVWIVDGIAEDEMDPLTIYPNPTNGLITIEGLNPASAYTISILNSVGKQVLYREITRANEKLDMTDMPSGLYFIQVQNKSGLATSYKINKL